MKKTFVPLLAVILLAVGSLSAQISNAVKADIPFGFTAGNITMPAGEYQIANSDHPGTLLIRSEGSSGMFVGANAAQANGRAGSTKLVFHRYGDRYFLYQIWVQGEDRGSEVPMTKFEKELSASNARPSSVTILARK
jgi:hypothetical protein